MAYIFDVNADVRLPYFNKVPKNVTLAAVKLLNKYGVYYGEHVPNCTLRDE